MNDIEQSSLRRWARFSAIVYDSVKQRAEGKAVGDYIGNLRLHSIMRIDVVHKTARISSDSIPSLPPDNHHSSDDVSVTPRE